MSQSILFGSAALALLLMGCADTDAKDSPPTDPRLGPMLKRFRSARAFQSYLRSLPREPLRYFDVSEPAPPPPSAMPAIAVAAPAAPGNPEITNNQSVGVDEGGIVKQIGNYLVVLQDGRVFSVDLGKGGAAPLRLADRIDVYRDPQRAASWYDEMLVLGDRILVTAYNYSERASEITVLRLGGNGQLTREGRFLLSSNDYYSTENYATRLVGNSLVFYAPFDLGGYGGPFEWPRLRRADGDAEANSGRALFGPTEIYAPIGKVEYPVLHTISICPLGQDMACRTTAFVGPAMREFYVSPADAFLWIGAPDGLPWSIDYANRRRTGCDAYGVNRQQQAAAMLYRLPLNGAPVGAVAVEGVPADQFAFDSHGGRFRALLARPGCAKPEGRDPLALLDLPLSMFGSTVRRAGSGAYAPLPPIEGGELENRFIGEWLVYGGRAAWSARTPEGKPPMQSTIVAVPLARPLAPTRLNVPHNAIRIERAGGDAIVTGYRDTNGLSISYVSLIGNGPRLASSIVLPNRFETEGRSHAFNAWVRPDGSGVMGIPTSTREWRSGRGWSNSENSDLSFVGLTAGKALASAGELSLRGRAPARGYQCEVSCVDWYGNSRPIFTGGRIFALMGTELVEGVMDGGRISEVARADLTAPLERAQRTAKR